MKRVSLGVIPLLLIAFGLSGCNAAGEKATSLSGIYGMAAVLSLLLLIGAFFLVRKKRTWIILLFSSVLVVNLGYTFLSVSTSLEMALQANRVAYLGSVFLPLAMLMIILDISGTKYPKWLHGALGALSIIVFLIAASPGILPIYYKEVYFAVVNGASTLVKVYGPLHPLYLVYLLGYFTAMVTIIIRAQIKKTIDTTAHAVILAIAVFVNIGVWFIEQITTIDFEILSISYIISELFLLGVHLVMNENQRLRETVKKIALAQTYSHSKTAPVAVLSNPSEITLEQVEVFLQGLNQLTPTERAVYEAYISRLTTREVMANLSITENTLKYHNRHIYSKLGVSSRKELLDVHKYMESIKPQPSTE